MTVVETVVTTLEHLIADRGRARIAFPGGRSAVGLMQELATQPLEWSAIDVTLVDERAVPETDQASNARLVKQTLCTDHASLARFEPLLVESDAMHSVRTLNQRECSIDIAILGMGEDGHFASLFPRQSAVPGLGDDVDGFVATDAVGSPSVPRISMTLTRILSAPLVVLLVSSEAKKEKVLAGLRGLDPMNPVSYLLVANHPIVIEWPDGSTETIQGGVAQ